MNEYCMLETVNHNYEEIKSIAKEYLLQIKTKKNCLKEIYEVIKSKHSYDVLNLLFLL